jgi:COMPASS component SWD1
MAGAADAAKHKVYVWDLSQEGVLHETLEGGREALVDVEVMVTLFIPASLLTRNVEVAPEQTCNGVNDEPR